MATALGRRQVLTLLGGAAAGPVLIPRVARAQQPAMPVVGFLDSQSREARADRLRAFRQGLKDTGYVEGDNVTIVYRFADNQLDRLPALAVDLLRRPVAAIIAPSAFSAVAAKAATMTVPIVFTIGDDPVRLGLVASVARPGGNLTGINFFNAELAAKRLEILRELMPTTVRVAVLVDPTNPTTETTLRDLDVAARAIGLQIRVFNVRTGGEINAAFASFARERPDAVYVSGGNVFNSRRVQLAHLASYHRLPAIFPNRESTEIGGLISYGSDVDDAWRQAGAYAGRIVKGTKPADLPVVQASKFELVINAETARMLGLTVPPSLIAIADEVIE